MRFAKWLVEANVSQLSFSKLLSSELGRKVHQSTVSRLTAAKRPPPALQVVLAIKKLTGGQVAEVDWLPVKRRAP